MSYPPTPSKKSCNCEDACISTDDVYYAGPNLPNSGINTYNILTSVIEKLDAIYAVPTLQRVTETGNVTTLPIIADSFVKIGGNGTNVLLDNGTTISLSSIGGSQNLQEVTDISAITTNPITANAFIKSGGDGNNLLLDDGTVLPISDLPVGVTKTSELINDGQDGIHPFITAEDIPAFVPSDYDLDEFTNNNVDPFAKISDLPVYSDFIQDSITNGVIDKAPTENAVYDALQLKQDSLGYTPVNKAGDTMLGDLILNQDPSTALGAATKQYVDNIVTGINFHPPVVVATDVSLVATYNNGIDGVGATLTGPSVGVLMIDGETPTYLQRILVWQQADPIQNGIYDLTTVGDSVTVYQLTRSADADNSPPGEIHYGDYTLTLSGDTNGGFGFICNTPGTIDIGTTPINYVQFNAAQAVTAGYGLQELTPNVIEIDALVTQEKITLTTTGSYGPATFITNTLNIPTLLQATASVNGYLTSTDWNTFNNKEDAISSGTSLQYWRGDKTFQTLNTSVVPENTNLYFTNSRAQSALAGMYEVPLTFSTPLIRTINAISIQQSNTSTNGYLSSTDFTTFTNKENSANKQNSLAVDGTGTKFPTVDAVNAGISSANYWTKTGNNIYNNNTGKVSIGANLDLAKLSIRGTSYDQGGGISLNTGGADWRVFASDYNAVQNGNGASAGFHITGVPTDSAFWIGGWSACVSNSFQSPTLSALATPMAIRGVTGQTGDFMQIRSNRTVTTGDIMTVKSTGLVTLPTVTNALIEADTTYKAVVTKEYVNNRLVVETTIGYTLTNADSGGIVIFKTTVTQTLTIPTGLADGFECTFVTLSGVTLTVVSTGNTLNNNTGTVMLPQLSFTLKRMLATNTYITAGSL